VRNKILAVLLLLVMLNMSFVVAIYAVDPVEQSKGGFNVQKSEIERGKPTGGGGSKPSGGIATGTLGATGGKQYAIIIGISDYSGSKNDLQYCDDDAVDFQNALPGSYDKKILINDEASRGAILGAINSLKGKVTEKDEVVFFYSGHGSTGSNIADGDSERKDECIIPYECTWESLIWDGELATAFSGFTCRIMFYFDSCYAGGMTELAGPNRLICMACGESQLSLESGAWQNGQFTYYFVDQGMLQKKADTNGMDGVVTFEEAFDYARANCLKQTPVASDGFQYDMPP
jgi:metacaspase-1